MNDERKNPFPGLRPFLFHEHELFFGREEQYEQMIARLGQTRFLAVVGTSGSGKSSLVRAGLLPALYGGLYGGLLPAAGPNWKVAVFRPKDDPIRELALALNHRRVFGDRARENGSSLFRLSESVDWQGLCSRLQDESNRDGRNPGRRILEMLTPLKRQVLAHAAGNREIEDRSEVVHTFNEVLKQRDLYQPDNFRRVPVSGEVRDLLTHGQSRLTNAQVEKLNRLLLEASYPKEIAKNGEIQAQITEVTLRRGDLGLIEAAREAKMSPDENLLIVVDQFEELFRYKAMSEHGPHGNQAAAFVKLLLEARAQRDVPIYVVLTMRSDYLGDCAKFWDLPEAINCSQYLIPRLTRDQRREAIKGPVKLRGADITPQLVNQLLNDMGDDPDQLPILQHALMRTWDKWERDHAPNESLDVRHYVAIGKMACALSIHADEAFKELPDERSRWIATQIFKCLTERGSGHRETRRPTNVAIIRSITRAKFKEIVAVIDVFRQEGRSFLMPSWRKPIRRGSSIDISHESLIRNWTKLSGWVKQEALSANIYRRLVETDRLHRQGGADLLTGLEVDYAMKWREREKPNVTWASRYHPELEVINKTACDNNSEAALRLRDEETFDSAMAFFDESRKAHELAMVRKEEMRRRELRQGQIRKFAAVIAGAFIILTVAAGVIFMQWRDVKKANRIRAHLIYSAEMNLAQGEYENGNFAKVNQFLQDPNDILAQEVSLRGFEWYHLWMLSHSELRTVAKYDAGVLSVTVSDNRQIIAAGKENGTVELQDLNSGEKISTLGKPSESVSMVATSTDGRRVAVGRKDGTVELWTISDDRLRTTQQAALVKQQNSESQPVMSLVFSGDNKLLAAGLQNGDARIWEADTGKEIIGPRRRGFGPAQSLAFAPDNKSLAIGRTGSVTQVEVLSGKTLLTVDTRQTVPIDERPSAEPVPINALAFSADGKTLVIGQTDSTIAIWDLVENKFLTSLVGHSMEVGTVAVSQEGVLATGSADGTIKLWNLHWLLEPENRNSLIARNAYLEVPAKLPSRGSLSRKKPIADDNIEREFRTQVSQNLLIDSVNGHAGPVRSVVFIGDSKFLSGSQDHTVKLWATDRTNTAKSSVKVRLESHHGLSSLAFSGDGKLLATASYDGSVELCNVNAKQTGSGSEQRRELQKADDPPVPIVFAVAFSPDDRLLATGSLDKNVTLWDVSSGQKVAQLSGHSNSVLSLAFSPDRKTLASGGADKTVRLWDVNTRRQLGQIDQLGAVLSLAFSPDGSMLAIGLADRNVSLWNMKEGRLAFSLNGHKDAVSSVAFSRDGRTLATGSWDTTAKLWDTGTGQELTTLQGHSQKVLSISFSPDSSRLATASQDGSVKLWDTSYELQDNNTRHALVTLKGQDGVSLVAAVAVAFKPVDGKILAIGNSDGTALLRYAAPDDLVAQQRR